MLASLKSIRGIRGIRGRIARKMGLVLTSIKIRERIRIREMGRTG
jgi:flagellar biosynthesis component FlhA